MNNELFRYWSYCTSINLTGKNIPLEKYMPKRANRAIKTKGFCVLCVCVWFWGTLMKDLLYHYFTYTSSTETQHNNKFLLPEFITGSWRVSACQKHSSENAWRFYQTLIQRLARNISLYEMIQTNSSDIFTLCSWRTQQLWTYSSRKRLRLVYGTIRNSSWNTHYMLKNVWHILNYFLFSLSSVPPGHVRLTQLVDMELQREILK